MSLAQAMIDAARVWDREENDAYPTPPDVTQALANWLNEHRPGVTTVYEPACGEGQMARVLERNGYRVIASDKFDTGYGYRADFLDSGEPDLYDAVNYVDAVITNPPFDQAAPFLVRARHHGLSGRPLVAMLLKTQFFQAKNRLSLFEMHRPAWKLELSWRPAFKQDTRGNAPIMECAWFVWDSEDALITEYDVLQRPRGMATFLPAEMPVLLARLRNARDKNTAMRL